MNLSISLLAFKDLTTFIDNIPLLTTLNISNVEGVYSKLEEYSNVIEENGFNLKSTQSLLYNSGVEDFLSPEFVPYLKKTIQVYKRYGIDTLVLGSPKQRKSYDIDKLIQIFKELDLICQQEGILLCIEPNCKEYGGNYFFNLDEIVGFIKLGKFSNIKTMIDTHNLLNENVSPSVSLKKYSEYVSHIHISEPQLKPIQDSKEHVLLSKTIKELNYQGIVNYELLPSENLNIQTFTNLYR